MPLPPPQSPAAGGVIHPWTCHGLATLGTSTLLPSPFLIAEPPVSSRPPPTGALSSARKAHLESTSRHTTEQLSRSNTIQPPQPGITAQRGLSPRTLYGSKLAFIAEGPLPLLHCLAAWPHKKAANLQTRPTNYLGLDSKPSPLWSLHNCSSVLFWHLCPSLSKQAYLTPNSDPYICPPHSLRRFSL